MRHPVRSVVLLVVAAGAVLLFYGIRSNLRADGFLAAVHGRDVDAVRDLLARDPTLLQTHVMPQGSQASNRTGVRRSTWRGRMPVHIVATDMFDESVAVADAMFAAGAHFKDRIDGDTTLHLAAASGRIAMVAWLLDKGLDVNARNGCEHPARAICGSGQFADWEPFDRERAGGVVCTGCEHAGQTPLHAAQRSMHAFDVSTLLLARGADVHATDAAGRTPLHTAAVSNPGSEDSRVLCGHGADPAARDHQGRQPADVAREAMTPEAARHPVTGNTETVDWLAPGGGCARLAARASAAGAALPAEQVDAAWREFVCAREPGRCGS